MKRCFSRINPVTAFVYIVFSLTVAMWSMHPLIVGMSFVTAVLWCGFLVGWGNTAKSLGAVLPVMAIVAAVNPLLVHRGDNILFFVNDNPFTLEATLYGVDMAVLFGAIYYRCKCLNVVLTSDKVVYLFGSFAPKLSSLLMLAIGFVPRLKRRYGQIDDAQRALGVYGDGFVDRLRHKLRVIGILVADSLESGIVTADSMKSRGFGLKSRTNYNPYVFTIVDIVLLAATVVFGSASVTFLALRVCDFAFYPTIGTLRFGLTQLLCIVSCGLLFALPVIAEIREDCLWLRLK